MRYSTGVLVMYRVAGRRPASSAPSAPPVLGSCALLAVCTHRVTHMAPTQRLGHILGHLGPAAVDEDGEAGQQVVQMNQTMMGGAGGGGGGAMSMVTGMLPLLAIGAYTMFQSRRNNKDENRELSQLEMTAENHGFDAERMLQVKEWAERITKSKKFPGVVIAVSRKSEVVYHEAFGDRSYMPDSIVSIESMAASIVTAAFMALVDEGLCSVDDDVMQYIPSFANFRVYQSGTTPATLDTVPLGAPIKISHILTNTWGFPGQFFHASRKPEIRMLDAMAADVQPTIGNDAEFDALTEIPLVDQPGRSYRVGLSYSVIGHIITKIVGGLSQDHPLSGKTLPEVVKAKVLEPLGMEDTAWSVPAPNQHRVAALHKANPWITNRLWGRRLTGEHSGHKSWLGWVGKLERRSVPESDPAEISENTSMFSTALDQLLFHQMLLAGGVSASGERVLSQASAAAMTTDQLPQPLSTPDFNSHANDKKNSSGFKSPVFGVDAEGQGVSFGMNVVDGPSKSKLAGSKGSFSSWGYYGTECWSDPALDMTVFVGTQLSPFWALPENRQELAGLIYGALVSTSAAKHFKGGTADGGGGMGMMNMMMMMSMMGGMGGMGRS